MTLALRQIILGIDRLHRAFRNTQRAIDALVRIDHQEIRPLAETVHRAHVHTVGIFASDAGFGDNIGHGSTPIINSVYFSRALKIKFTSQQGRFWLGCHLKSSDSLPTSRLTHSEPTLTKRDSAMSEHIHYVSDATFDAEVLQAPLPVLVDYWAEWCGPCRMIAPVLDEIAKEYSGRLTIAKLNVDENQQTPAKFGIRGIPTLMLFKNGDVAATKVGALSKSQLTAFIDSNI